MSLLLALGSLQLQAKDYLLMDRIGISAESIALGRVMGNSNQANAIFGNPAALFRIPRYSISAFNLSHMNHRVQFFNLAAAYRWGDGVFSMGVLRGSTNGIPVVSDFIQTDSTHYRNVMTKLAYQRLINPRISVGLAGTYYLTSSHLQTGKGTNIDLGLIYRRKDSHIGLLLKNILPRSVQYSHQSESDFSAQEAIPSALQVSLKSAPTMGLQFLPQLNFSRHSLANGDKSFFILPSMGVLFHPIHWPLIDLRAGLHRELSITLTQRTRYAFGIGLDLYNLYFAYTFERNEFELDPNMHYFSVSINQ
ncbi:MAG: hypothetical protein CL521_05800 [Actinobacteria bacterium]|nr:hypothetical protein [Actinomycetota bacterium]